METIPAGGTSPDDIAWDKVGKGSIVHGKDFTGKWYVKKLIMSMRNIYIPAGPS